MTYQRFEDYVEACLLPSRLADFNKYYATLIRERHSPDAEKGILHVKLGIEGDDSAFFVGNFNPDKEGFDDLAALVKHARGYLRGSGVKVVTKRQIPKKTPDIEPVHVLS